MLLIFNICGILLTYIFNIYLCWNDYIELTTNDTNIYCSGNVGNNNQTPIPQGSGNQQSNIPPGNNNNNPHHGFFYNNSSNDDNDNTLPHDTEQAQESLRKCMAKKLNEHRVACAERGADRGWDGADTRLDGKFSDPENEYICDKVMQYKQIVPNSTFHKNITGVYPDRKYTGLISMGFVDKVFGPK